MSPDIENFEVDGGVVATSYTSQDGMTVLSATASQKGWREFFMMVADLAPIRVPGQVRVTLTRQGFDPCLFR